MVTLLFASFTLLALISFALYRWQRKAWSGETANRVLAPPPAFTGLFADADREFESAHKAEQLAQDALRLKQELLEHARRGEKEALVEAHRAGDEGLYVEVLDALTASAQTHTQLFALVSYIARSGEALTVTPPLARAFIETWRRQPTRRTTAQMLHVAAMTGDASVYQTAVEQAFQGWREGRLQDIKAEELALLAESEFWLLAPGARASGAGFLLKRRLAALRRELATKTVTGDR